MYFVKLVSRATKDNPSYAGDVSVAIYGKAEKLVALGGNHSDRLHTVQEFFPPFAKQYGYKRLCDARRSWIFNNADEGKYWETEASIIEIDC